MEERIPLNANTENGKTSIANGCPDVVHPMRKEMMYTDRALGFS
jgi:hypothetical protein